MGAARRDHVGSHAVLTAGQPHQLRIEYLQLDFDALLKLQWHSVNGKSATRVAWIPPGDWIDAWTGETVSGPATVTNQVPLDEIPIYVRSGAILPLAPEMQFTGEKPWNPITLDLYPRAAETNSANLYEDDTLTMAYQHGEFRNTTLTASADDANKIVRVGIGAAKGNFHGALKKRAWTLRIHPPAGWPKNLAPTDIRVNGEKINVPIQLLNRDAAAMPFGDKSGAPDARRLSKSDCPPRRFPKASRWKLLSSRTGVAPVSDFRDSILQNADRHPFGLGHEGILAAAAEFAKISRKMNR